MQKEQWYILVVTAAINIHLKNNKSIQLDLIILSTQDKGAPYFQIPGECSSLHNKENTEPTPQIQHLPFKWAARLLQGWQSCMPGS